MNIAFTAADPIGKRMLEEVPDGYIVGLGRSVPYPAKSHLYKGTFDDPGLPMCRHGWNRDNGGAYSIWRGNIGADGICKTCLRRAKMGLDGIEAKGESEE